MSRKQRILLGFIMTMCLLTSSALASSKEDWRKDIDYIVSTRYKIFELYPAMSFDDFQSAWRNVPGWKTLEFAQENATEGGPEWISIFEKELPPGTKYREQLEVFAKTGENLGVTELVFSTNNMQLGPAMFYYAASQFEKASYQHSKQRKYMKDDYYRTAIRFAMPAGDRLCIMEVSMQILNHNKCIVYISNDRFVKGDLSFFLRL